MNSCERIILILCLAFLIGGLPNTINPDCHAESLQLTDDGERLISLCRNVMAVFDQHADAIWPGYDLTEFPFLAYVPDQWAVLINYPHQPPGFVPYPEYWPSLPGNAWLYPGRYQNLAGQLSFWVPVDSIKVAAVPLLERSNNDMLAFIIHENFHEYQFEHFGEIPWEREERYPMLDTENSALAALELQLLIDAVYAAANGEREMCRKRTGQFVAVRDYRWGQMDPFIARYEQGQELNEGTAKYVELKSMDCLPKIIGNDPAIGPKFFDVSAVSISEQIPTDARKRLTGNAIAPDDMPRYRIYPVGSAQAFLLDYFGVEWKTQAQQAGREFTFATLLRDHLGLQERHFPKLIDEAKGAFGYSRILTETDSLTKAYLAGFEKEYEDFNTQIGYAIAVTVNTNGMRRSQSSSARHWLVEQGTIDFRNQVDIYSLSKGGFEFYVHDVGLVQKNNWDTKDRTVQFYLTEPPELIIDGEQMVPTADRKIVFDKITISHEQMDLATDWPGTLTCRQDGLEIDFVR